MTQLIIKCRSKSKSENDQTQMIEDKIKLKHTRAISRKLQFSTTMMVMIMVYFRLQLCREYLSLEYRCSIERQTDEPIEKI